MPRGEENVREPPLPVDLKPIPDGADTLDPHGTQALVPAATVPQCGHVVEELLDRRVVAVEDRLHKRPQAAAAVDRANRETREGGCEAVAVALRAHRPLIDRAGAATPGLGGIASRAEHRDLARLQPAVAKRDIGAEGRESRSHDGDRLGGHAT
jgi:hypothetical protein